MRTIKINAEGLVDLLEKQAKIHKAQVKINKELSDLDTERTKNGYKSEKIKEKMKPIIDELVPTFELGEFEIITSISLNNGQPEAVILDMVEEYINMLREKK